MRSVAYEMIVCRMSTREVEAAAHKYTAAMNGMRAPLNAILEFAKRYSHTHKYGIRSFSKLVCIYLVFAS